VPAGHYEWNVMHFGLKHAPSKFQKVMDSIFKPCFNWLLVYIDDILIFSKNIQDHFKHVQTFVQLVKRNGLVLSKKKIEVFQTSVKFLGHAIFNGPFVQLVKRNGLVLSKKKIEVFQTSIKFLGHAIFNGQISLQKHALEFSEKFPDIIIDKTHLQRFIGCLNYVSNFYQDCAKDRSLLNQRLKKNPLPWTEAHTKAVQRIKGKVKTLPIFYVADDNAFKIVKSDASNIS